MYWHYLVQTTTEKSTVRGMHTVLSESTIKRIKGFSNGCVVMLQGEKRRGAVKSRRVRKIYYDNHVHKYGLGSAATLQCNMFPAWRSVSCIKRSLLTCLWKPKYKAGSDVINWIKKSNIFILLMPLSACICAYI